MHLLSLARHLLTILLLLTAHIPSISSINGYYVFISLVFTAQFNDVTALFPFPAPKLPHVHMFVCMHACLLVCWQVVL